MYFEKLTYIGKTLSIVGQYRGKFVSFVEELFFKFVWHRAVAQLVEHLLKLGVVVASRFDDGLNPASYSNIPTHAVRVGGLNPSSPAKQNKSVRKRR